MLSEMAPQPGRTRPNCLSLCSLSVAIDAFEEASAAEPESIRCSATTRALTIYEIRGADAAKVTLQQAVELERAQPIADWGKRMERVQGRNRNWVESARRTAPRAN